MKFNDEDMKGSLELGRRKERKRIFGIIDDFCFGDTEESIEVKRSLKDAVGGLNE